MSIFFSRRCQCLAGLLLVAALGATGSAAGPIIVDTGGFESYSLGTLNPQQSWITDALPGSATVQSSVVKSGAKAVQLTRAANADKRWARVTTGVPTNRFFSIEWDMRVTATGAASGFGPFFGVEAYHVIDNSNYAQFGSLGVDATTGDVVFLSQASDLTATGLPASFDVWHHYQMVFDRTQDEYSVYFDGLFAAADSFYGPGFVPDQLTNSGFVAVSAAGDAASMARPGTAYVDNYVVYDGIPADFNFDGKVNDADFDSWKNAFGSTNVGDADGDSDSDGADFLTWQRARGYDYFAATAANAVVPEPGTALLGLAALWSAAAMRRSRRR